MKKTTITTGKKNGFTLIELLVVISIIAVLMAIMMPALNKVRQQAKLLICKTNMKNIGIAVNTYTNDYGGSYPLVGNRDAAGRLPNWGGGYPAPPYWDAVVMPYMYSEYNANPKANNQMLLSKYEKMFDIWCCPGIKGEPEFRSVYNNITSGTDSRATNRYPRSYRMNAMLGGHAAVNGPYSSRDFEDLSSNPGARAYTVSVKTHQVESSSNTFLILDGGLDNGGCFNNRYGWARYWSDLKPAHFVKRTVNTFKDTWGDTEARKGICNALFADGHIEKIDRVYSDEKVDGQSFWEYGSDTNRDVYKFYAGNYRR
jgi:prepilin-type N-terminal cleavage/methylation domain-containing protein/prepilin-type processing-associated H-X9-DG protein